MHVLGKRGAANPRIANRYTIYYPIYYLLPSRLCATNTYSTHYDYHSHILSEKNKQINTVKCYCKSKPRSIMRNLKSVRNKRNLKDKRRASRISHAYFFVFFSLSTEESPGVILEFSALMFVRDLTNKIRQHERDSDTRIQPACSSNVHDTRRHHPPHRFRVRALHSPQRDIYICTPAAPYLPLHFPACIIFASSSREVTIEQSEITNYRLCCYIRQLCSKCFNQWFN